MLFSVDDEEDRPASLAAPHHLVRLAKANEDLSWGEFIDTYALKSLFAKQEKQIHTLFESYYTALSNVGFTVGLALFTPALAPLVGQNYEMLKNVSDWVKAMTYTKAVGPAGFPLEVMCLANGLRSLDPTIKEERALTFSGALLGLSKAEIHHFCQEKRFTSALLEEEIIRSRSMNPKSVAGIELVNHPLFPTNISTEEAKEMIGVVQRLKSDLIACWNLLYIPFSNISSLLS